MKREDFAKFFAAVNGGHAPFRWQERLLDTILETGQWPDRIDAPTGAGKTAAIDVHVFATALTAASPGRRPPRRLAMVVDRRVLVDDQYAHARALADMLGTPGRQTPEVAEVAEILTGLHTAEGEEAKEAPPLVTARLRGGSVPSRSWADYPTACAVLCATPDMWGSRLLLRGYGSSWKAAAREAGLLAFDSAVMIDEAHLSRQLTATAARVSRLARVAEQPLTAVPPLQVVEVTATPAGEGRGRTVSVGDGDLAEEKLARRLTRPKPVTVLKLPEWPTGRQLARAAAVIAQAVAAVRAQTAPPDDPADAGTVAATVGCFVNTVPMAMAVADALRKKDLRVVTVCGQARPADITRLGAYYAGILTTRGNDEVDVVVSTQSLEVGADLDFAGMVTELASGSALAQRAGRVNRLGKRPYGPVTVIGPSREITDKTSSGPYGPGELREALEWVCRRADDDQGLAPWAVRADKPPVARGRRTLYQRPEVADAWHWSRTSDDLAAPPELDLWLSDSLEAETSVGIVVRDALPADPAEAAEFLRDLPPAPWETFPVPYKTARSVLAELGRDRDVRPGDVVVIDSSAEVFTRPPGSGFSPQVVTARASDDETDGVDTARRGRADDVLHHQADLRPGSIRLRLETSGDGPVAGMPEVVAQAVRDSDRSRTSIASILGGAADTAGPLKPLFREARRLLRGRVKDSDVIVRESGEDRVRVLVIDRRRAVADEDLRQVYTPRDREVLLSAHQHDVAERGATIAARLGLTHLENAFRIAGEHHDDGKADPRFQSGRLGSEDPGKLLAKSAPGRTAREVREQEQRGGLPGQWRHEQRSVVDSWTAAQSAPDADPDLVRRLIGTSHGHGRAGFPHTADGLAGPLEPRETGWFGRAAELFDDGAWDELIETTHIRYGVWGCAYLEALFRAADCQVSREGR